MHKTVEIFLSTIRQRGRSVNTIEGYAIDLEQFEAFLCPKSIVAATDEDIQKFGDNLAKTAQARTVRRKVASVKSYMRFNGKPTKCIETPAVPDLGVKALTYIETDKLFRGLQRDKSPEGVRLLAICELLYCGLRNSEVRNLERKRINLQDRAVTVIAKGNREVLYPLSESAVSALRAHLEIDQNSTMPFSMSRSNMVHLVSAAGRRILKKTITPHTLRHSIALHLLESGVDIRHLQDLLHHKNISTTMIYTKSSVRKLNEIFSGHHPRNK